jgi:hypothetical protein
MWWTAHLLAAVHPAETFRTIVAGAFAALRLTVALLGVWAFRHAKTTVDPIHPKAASSGHPHGHFCFPLSAGPDSTAASHYKKRTVPGCGLYL